MPFIPIPLPEKVLQTSSCAILLYRFVLQTGFGMGMGINGTAQCMRMASDKRASVHEKRAGRQASERALVRHANVARGPEVYPPAADRVPGPARPEVHPLRGGRRGRRAGRCSLVWCTYIYIYIHIICI